MNTRSLIALAVLAVTGCAQNNVSMPPPSLVGTKWRLEELAGAPAVANAEATLEFLDSSKVAGRGSCNRFFGTVVVAGSSLQFGPIGVTKMACLDTLVMNQETRYLAALQDAERFERDSTTLLVYSKGSDQPLRFVPASP